MRLLFRCPYVGNAVLMIYWELIDKEFWSSRSGGLRTYRIAENKTNTWVKLIKVADYHYVSFSKVEVEPGDSTGFRTYLNFFDFL